MLWLQTIRKYIGLAAKPEEGSRAQSEAADVISNDVSRGLTPAAVDKMMTAANTGETLEYCRLAMDLEEKNWDIGQAVQTRRLAVAGLEWSVEPPEGLADGGNEDGKGGDTSRAQHIAEAAEQMLRAVPYEGADELESFDQALRYGLQGALLPGFAALEMVWGKGGAELLGFQEIEQRHFLFRDETGMLLSRPRLRTSEVAAGVELPQGKFVVHFHRARPGARCRGGMARPLAWLHCFQNTNLKDLMTFIERYGMPFLLTRVNDQAWKEDRAKIAALVRNFGPAGGAVFSNNVEAELLQAASNSGDVYFKLLQYCGDAITKVVLGQLASSADASGLSKGNEQGKVRQDLIEADARALETTVRMQILRPWVMWNYGPDAPVPRLHLHSEPPEDVKATADTAASLFNAGLEWDSEEASERMGMKLTRKAPAPVPTFGQAEMPPAAEGTRPPGPPEKAAPAGSVGDSAAAAAPGAEPSTAEDDALALADAPTADLRLPTSEALADFLKGQGLKRWFGPLQAAIDAAVSEPDPEAFRAKVLALTADLPGLYERMDSTEFEALLEGTIYQAAAEGLADGGNALRAKSLAGGGKGAP